MKDPSGMLVKSDLYQHEMRKVVMKTAEPASTREATEQMVKILNNTYAKADLKQVADNATQMKAEEITQLLRLLEDSKDLFGGTLVDWSADPINLYLKPCSKPFNSKY